MIENQRLFAVLGVLVMVLAALGPAGVLADEDSDELDVVVAQNDDYEVTITVTENGTPVEGANVTVDSRAVVTVYDGEGEYVTDANGTVNLPAPEDDIKVDITVSYNNSTVTRAVELNANETDDEDDDSLAVNVTQADDGNATVTVTDNGTPASGANVTVETVRPFDEYNGTGEYVADANGTVELPAPEKVVGVTITAEYNDSTETEDERLVPDEFGPPDDAGDEGDDKGDGEGPPDDAGDDEGDGEGPPDDAGDDEGDGEGPPDDVGDEGDGEGPPDDAGT